MEMNKKMDDGKNSTEPLKEELNKNTQEQIINNNNKKEEESINTKPVIELIKENDNIKSCELSNEHGETVNKNMETPYKKINNNNGVTEVNNKDTKEIINVHKPLIIIENTDKNPEPLNKKLKETNNTKTPEAVSYTHLKFYDETNFFKH